MSPDLEELIVSLMQFTADPLGFVYFAFPWNQPGTELFKDGVELGPEQWQIDILCQLGAGIITYTQAIQLARTSGHGIGKSALVSWIILWALCTFEDTKGVVTANTETQLKTKTWAELAKWYRLCVGKPLFHMTATALFSVDPEHEKTWRIDMVPWSERNTEAFAGLHNQGKRILVVFDEGSAIPDVIYEVTEGALTDLDTQIIWAVFGNPTRNKGRFRECFEGGKFHHRWKALAIDSREVRFTDKQQIQRWIDDYGLDSDFVRVRVRGVFPRVDAISFISYEVAVAASLRAVPERNSDPVVLGVDPARFGDDASVIYPRQGRDARSRPIEIYFGMDTMTFAAKVAAAADKWHASAIMCDEGGVGGGVVDRLRQLGYKVWGVDFGRSPDGTNPDDSGTKYYNKRAEIWGAIRNWLPAASIPNEVPSQDLTLIDELTGPTYSMSGQEEIQLEGKKEMRRRGVPSPNVADALACSHAYPVRRFIESEYDRLIGGAKKPHVEPDYDPYSRERMMAN